MRLIKTITLVFLLAGQCGLASAGDAVRAFASELMFHESKQVVRTGPPLKYSDPDGGAALRALLAPARARIVLDDYFWGAANDATQPDLPRLTSPIIKRYEQAFKADPGTYEEEYLDALNLVVGPLEGQVKASANLQKSAVLSGDDGYATQKLLDGLQSLSDSMMKFIAQNIRDKANSGVYSAAGKERALAMADRVTALVRSGAASQVVVSQQALATAGPVSAKDIAESYTRHSLLDSDALDQLGQCNTIVPRQRYEQLIDNTRNGETVTGFLGQTAAPKLVSISGQYWTCLGVSSTGFLIFPVDVLRNTVVTVGASRVGLANWRRQLLAELAQNGRAVGLIELRNGSAWRASYTLTRGVGATLSYEATLLNAGGYNRGDYSIVISEPTITHVVRVSFGEVSAKNSAMLLSPLARAPLTSDGYIPIVGSAATAAANFTGSVWRLESVDGPATLLRLHPQGVAAYQTSGGSQPGHWRVAGNVLQVYLNSEVRYSLALTDDGRFLQGEVRRRELSRANIPGLSLPPEHDDHEADLRFKVSRFYRESDAEYEKVVAAKREVAKQAAGDAVQKLIAQVEERKLKILAETPEQEEREVANVISQGGKAQYTWRVCGGELQSQLMFASMTSPSSAGQLGGKSVGEICYAWLGSRKDWKATILQQGCNKRCDRY